VAATAAPSRPVSFQTHPSRYQHWKLSIDGDVASLVMAVQQAHGQRDGYELKLNSYDIGVDVELADAVQRIRFEHPEVRCVVLTGGFDRVFCAGANIVMLRTSTHGFKVNFCKYTNETRLYLEDASANSGLKFLAALNGTASGGGYELALACDKILLVDDRNSAVSFPEVPLLGVLPGTGGLTRITDKRKVRRDHCDVFATVAEGIKGKRAVEWNLVDGLAPLSKWNESVRDMARKLADSVPQRATKGVVLDEISAAEDGDTFRYQYVEAKYERELRVVELTLTVPEAHAKNADDALAQGAKWWALRAFRELDDAVCTLRMNEPQIGLVVLRVKGSAATLRATDALLASGGNWFVSEVRHLVKRVLKRIDNSAKSFYAVADEGTCFVGTGLELALACDRTYLLDDPDRPVALGVTGANRGLFPMANGLSRLATRFLGTPERAEEVLAQQGDLDAPTANELGLATFAPGRDRLGRRAAPCDRGTRLVLARRDDRHGSEPALPRPRDHGDQDLRALVRLAELDLPTTQRSGRARRARLLRNPDATAVRRRANLGAWLVLPRFEAASKQAPKRLRSEEERARHRTGPALMTTVDFSQKIPNNVDLGSDKRLQRALEAWQPNYLEWWCSVGPTDFNSNEVYLRTAVDVGADGWAKFGYVKMPDYRWGILLAPKKRAASSASAITSASRPGSRCRASTATG
jgi:benzoyl-CoA-dihydrodiol lyase